MTTNTYSEAGPGGREIHQEQDDPCGYVTNTPDSYHLTINEEVTRGLQRCFEIKEAGTSEEAAKAWRVYNLARELASTVSTCKNRAELATLAARMHKVVDAI